MVVRPALAGMAKRPAMASGTHHAVRIRPETLARIKATVVARVGMGAPSGIAPRSGEAPSLAATCRHSSALPAGSSHATAA